MLTTRQIEDRLLESLRRDQAKAIQRAGIQLGGQPRTIMVDLSNESIGFTIAIEARTGEDQQAIIARLEGDI